jgi:hypothetical protein
MSVAGDIGTGGVPGVPADLELLDTDAGEAEDATEAGMA